MKKFSLFSLLRKLRREPLVSCWFLNKSIFVVKSTVAFLRILLTSRGLTKRYDFYSFSVSSHRIDDFVVSGLLLQVRLALLMLIVDPFSSCWSHKPVISFACTLKLKPFACAQLSVPRSSRLCRCQQSKTHRIR